MLEIKRVGGFLGIDKDGYIVKEASLDRITEKWKTVIKETIRAYKEHFGENLLSVYVRGSVAKGDAIDGISDLDTIAVLESFSKNKDTWGDVFSNEMVKKYPFVEKIEITAGTREQAVDPNRAVRIMLKTQAVCVFGKDISSEIPKLRPGKESCQHFRWLQHDLLDSIDFFEGQWGENEEENQKKITWITRRILRTGFELVMEREQKYTRDLHPCYESFSKYYPEKEKLMLTTLNLAINPVLEVNHILRVLKSWLVWMPQEIERIFDFKKL